jgi:hypothetical protein
MIIGCYRSNEVDDSHELSSKTRDLKEMSEKSGFTITELELGCLALDEVKSLVLAIMSMEAFVVKTFWQMFLNLKGD